MQLVICVYLYTSTVLLHRLLMTPSLLYSGEQKRSEQKYVRSVNASYLRFNLIPIVYTVESNPELLAPFKNNSGGCCVYTTYLLRNIGWKSNDGNVAYMYVSFAEPHTDLWRYERSISFLSLELNLL